MKIKDGEPTGEPTAQRGFGVQPLCTLDFTSVQSVHTANFEKAAGHLTRAPAGRTASQNAVARRDFCFSRRTSPCQAASPDELGCRRRRFTHLHSSNSSQCHCRTVPEVRPPTGVQSNRATAACSRGGEDRVTVHTQCQHGPRHLCTLVACARRDARCRWPASSLGGPGGQRASSAAVGSCMSRELQSGFLRHQARWQPVQELREGLHALNE